MGREAEGFLTIICREVLDVIDTAEGTPSQVKAEVRSLILSWVNANKLNIEAVKRIDGAYVVSWPRTKEVAWLSESKIVIGWFEGLRVGRNLGLKYVGAKIVVEVEALACGEISLTKKEWVSRISIVWRGETKCIIAVAVITGTAGTAEEWRRNDA